MLLAVQFPFADLRPFVSADTRRILDPGNFVRHVGREDVRINHFGDMWPWEEPYWTSKRGLLFPDRLDQINIGPWTPGRFRGAFRRLFWTESQLPRTRLELGITNVGYRWEPYYGATRGPDFDGQDARSILNDVLALQVGVAERGEVSYHELTQAPAHLARLLLRSTTKWKDAPGGFQPPSWSIQAGLPLVLLEYGFREHGEVPSDAVPVKDSRDTFTLHLLRSRVGGTVWPMWLLGIRDPGHTDVRLIRLHITRLHAEIQTLRLVLGSISREDSPERFRSNDPGISLLDRYLAKALGSIDKPAWYGGSSAALVSAVRESFAAFNPGLEDELNEQIDRASAFRPHLQKLLRDRPQAREALTAYREVKDA